jgi:DNA-binding transcriptional MerR regulator
MIEELKIGELADRAGVSRDTVRFYEKEGLLPPPRRNAAQYRVYGKEAAERLSFIRQAQAIGLSLDDIRELLRQHEARTPDECRHVAALLAERIATLDRKVAELRAFRGVLAKSLSRCEAAQSDECPVVLDLSRSSGRQKGS